MYAGLLCSEILQCLVRRMFGSGAWGAGSTNLSHLLTAVRLPYLGGIFPSWLGKRLCEIWDGRTIMDSPNPGH